MANRFSGPFFDLSLNLSSGCGVVDDDAELIVVDEEATCSPLTIGVERHRFDGQVTHVTADHHTNETKQATRYGVAVLGAVLHTREGKHGPSSRKGSKSPRKRLHDK